ncbi:MAG: ribulose-phosphate 3-epimerase [Clostridia bacterium]|nr:ribulose-phosphate 3-epimerase [Clostridia bacterium]
MNKYISASVMCADQMNLATQIKELEKAGIDYLHVDIMDGHFVPNITLGFDFVKDLKKITDIPLDVHMMVENPSAFLEYLPLESDDILCVHYEAETHIHRTLEQIKKKGCKAGLALNPATPLECAKYLTDYMDMLLVMTVSPGFAGQKLFAAAERKTAEARKMLNDCNCKHIPIEVDGNISIPNAQKLNKCGADIFVLGTSSLFLKDKLLFDAAVDFRTALGEE